jgi:predicted amidohydrolase
MTRAAIPRDPKIAMWAINHAHVLAGRDAWLDLLARQIEAARREGCDLLVLPEYASAHWLHWAGGPLSGLAFMHWMADEGAALLASMEALARSSGVGLVCGSMPHRAPGGGVFNRCWALLPDEAGGIARCHHDKLVATPPERPTGDWPIVCAKTLTVIEWRGWKFALLICLDVEIPAVIAALQEEAVDCLVVPSMTSFLAGYRRVFDCAKAAAIELFAAVAVLGGVGDLAWGMGENCSGAALYVPCEGALGSNGCVHAIGPMTHVDGPGPVAIATAPLGRIRALRQQGPEAWPGPVSAAGITTRRWEAQG